MSCWLAILRSIRTMHSMNCVCIARRGWGFRRKEANLDKERCPYTTPTEADLAAVAPLPDGEEEPVDEDEPSLWSKMTGSWFGGSGDK